MAYTPVNLNVYTAAYAGAIAGIGIPSGAFIINPNQSSYVPVTVVATAFAQAFDTAWGATPEANLYDIEAIAEACCNTFVKGSGAPMTGDVTTQDNWTIVATAIVALIKAGDGAATTGGITFPPVGSGGGGPVPQQYWVAPWGSDTTGTGSIFLPFHTIAHTQSIITDAAADKIYEIILYPGEYAEDVHCKAFTEIVGFDPTQTFNAVYPARINGNVDLGASFSTAGAAGWITAVDVDGTLTIDYPGVSAPGGVLFSVTNCQIEDDTVVTMALGGQTVEFHGTTFVGDFIQNGGTVLWENCAGIGNTVLHVKAVTGSSPILTMYDSAWLGDLHADQNGITDQLVTVTLNNSQCREGTVTVTAAGAFCPNVDAAYGAIPENVVLAGSVAAALSKQMRVSLGLTIPADTVLAANGDTDVVIPLPAGALGATSIEQLSCTMTPVGSNWGSLVTDGISWSFYVLGGGANEVHTVFYNPTESTVNTPGLPLLFYGFPPTNIG